MKPNQPPDCVKTLFSSLRLSDDETRPLRTCLLSVSVIFKLYPVLQAFK